MASWLRYKIRADERSSQHKGKEKKVAIIACIRKTLTILNAMMRDRQPFRLSFVV